MEIEISAFGLLLLAVLMLSWQAMKRRCDVLHGNFIERDFSKRLLAVVAP